MKEVFGNPYVRIALGAAISEYVKPGIINRFIRPELDARDDRINTQVSIGITAAVTTIVFVALGMVGGKTATEAVKTS